MAVYSESPLCERTWEEGVGSYYPQQLPRNGQARRVEDSLYPKAFIPSIVVSICLNEDTHGSGELRIIGQLDI
jgi:hypothetical protein